MIGQARRPSQRDDEHELEHVPQPGDGGDVRLSAWGSGARGRLEQEADAAAHAATGAVARRGHEGERVGSARAVRASSAPAVQAACGCDGPCHCQDGDDQLQHANDPDHDCQCDGPCHCQDEDDQLQHANDPDHDCQCDGPCHCQDEDDQLQHANDPDAQPSLLDTATGLIASMLSPVIVEDDAEVGPAQVTRSDFLAQVHDVVVRTGDKHLARVGRSTSDCPYLQHWLVRASSYSAPALERVVHLVTGPTTRSPQGYLDAITRNVGARVDAWINGGQADTPESFDRAVAALAPDEQGHPVQAKAEPGTSAAPPGGSSVAERVMSRLGPGRSLRDGQRQQMESGFGTTFEGVRIHTDPTAAALARERGALAFTVGSHLVFGADEFRPESLEGRALLAHELAHTIQQRGGGVVAPAAGVDHEDDADEAAAGALGFGAQRTPRLRAGLGLQGCTPTVKKCPPGMKWGRAAGSTDGTVGAGSFGCACVYKCVPDNDVHSDQPMLCPASGCRSVHYEIVGDDYVFERHGEVQHVPVSDRAAEDDRPVGWGGSSTPLTSQHMCLCPGVDIEGEEHGEGGNMTPITSDLTDIAGPLAEGAAVRRGGGNHPTPLPEDPPAIVRRIDEIPGSRRATDETPGPRRATDDVPGPRGQGVAPRSTDEHPSGPRPTEQPGPPTRRTTSNPDDLGHLKPEGTPEAQLEAGGVRVVRTTRSPDGMHEIKLLSDGTLVRCSAVCQRLRAFYKELVEGPNRSPEDVSLARELDGITTRSRSADPVVRSRATDEAAALEPRLRQRASSNLAQELHVPADAISPLLQLYPMARVRGMTDQIRQLASKPDAVRARFVEVMGQLDQVGQLDLVHNLELNRRGRVNNAVLEGTLDEVASLLARFPGRLRGDVASRVRRRADTEPAQAGAELTLATDLLGGGTALGRQRTVEGIPEGLQGQRIPEYLVTTPSGGQAYAEVKAVGVPEPGQAAAPLNEEAVRRNFGSALGQLRDRENKALTENLIRIDGRNAGPSAVTAADVQGWMRGELRTRVREGVETPVRWIEVIYNNPNGIQQRVTLEVRGQGEAIDVQVRR